MKWPVAYQTWGNDEILAAEAVLYSGQTTMGQQVAQFEENFSTYPGAPHSVMVNSGSSADFVMMMAAIHCGYLNPGCEVLIPAVTWPTQVWAVILAGMVPCFVDIDETLQVTPEAYEAAITPKTRGIFATHLMGNPGQIEAISELCSRRGLALFEDCCESLGASVGGRKVGTFGIASAFSFFHSHHISTMEGGMISTSDSEFDESCRMIRAHGWSSGDRSVFVGPGLNFRPTEINGAFGCVQLPKLAAMNRARNFNYDTLLLHTNNFGNFTRVLAHHKSKPAWFAFPVVLKDTDRNDFRVNLGRRGVESRHVAGGNLTRQPAFSKYAGQHLPMADKVHDRGLYVGLPPYEADMRPVADILNSL